MNAPPEAQVMELFAGVDDLIRRVADTENPEIRKVRAKVYAALVIARSACENGAHLRRLTPQEAVGTRESLEEYPGPALGFALLMGLGLGLVVSLRQ